MRSKDFPARSIRGKEISMSGLEIEGQLGAGTVNIRTLNRAWAADESGKLMLTKTSQVTFSGVAADVQHALKIAFLVKSNQDVDRFRITSHPSLVPVPDAPTASDADDVFGSDSGDKWIGWRIPYVGHWSTTLETEIRLRKFSDKPKHVQIIPIMFAFAIDAGGHDYGNHFLQGVSTCMGQGHTLLTETQTIFI
jgi:hypothetical protein